MYQRHHRLGANTNCLVILIAILLQVIQVVQPQTQLESSSIPFPFRSQQKLPQAYVNGVLSLKGSLLANNFQLRPIIYSNSGEQNAQQMNLNPNFGTQRKLSSDMDLGVNMQPPEQSEESKQLLAETKQNYRELSADLKLQQQQEEPKQQVRDEIKDELHQKLDQLQLELRKQDNQLMQQDLQLAAQVSAVTPSPIQQMPGPVHLPMEQLEAQSQSQQAQSQQETLNMPQVAQSQPQLEPQSALTMSEREAPPLVAQADGESNCYAKMQLLQQLAEYFGQSQPQQQQQQQQQQQPQQQLRSSIAKLSASDASPEEYEDEHGSSKTKTTDQCAPPENETKATTAPKSNKTTKATAATTQTATPNKNKEHKKTTTAKPKAKKLPCCSKKPKNKSSLESLHPKNLQSRSHRNTMQPNLRIDAFATLLRYRNKQSDSSLTQPKDSPKQVDLRKRRRKNKTQGKSKAKTRIQRRVVTRKQLLQAEIKLWPIKISH